MPSKKIGGRAIGAIVTAIACQVMAGGPGVPITAALFPDLK